MKSFKWKGSHWEGKSGGDTKSTEINELIPIMIAWSQGCPQRSFVKAVYARNAHDKEYLQLEKFQGLNSM